MQLMGVATIGSPLGTVLVQTALLVRTALLVQTGMPVRIGADPISLHGALLGDLFEEPFEHFRAHWILQFCNGFRFDLPYAFAGDFEYPADFL